MLDKRERPEEEPLLPAVGELWPWANEKERDRDFLTLWDMTYAQVMGQDQPRGPSILRVVREIPALRAELNKDAMDERLKAYQEKYPEEVFEIRKGKLYVQCGKIFRPSCVHTNHTVRCQPCKVVAIIQAGGPQKAHSQNEVAWPHTTRRRPAHFPVLLMMSTFPSAYINSRVGNSFCRSSSFGFIKGRIVSAAGGSSLCEKHWVPRHKCRRCKGSGICEEHPAYRKHECRICPGPGWCTKHKTQYSKCFRCDKNKACITCGVKKRQVDGYCTTHHPNYVPSKTQCSKVSCEAINRLQLELSVEFLHMHYDKSGGLSGSDYHLTDYRNKAVDAVFDYEGKRVLFRISRGLLAWPSSFPRQRKNNNKKRMRCVDGRAL